MDPESTITITAAKTGQMEALPVSLSNTSVQELCDWSVALFGLTGPVHHLFKDGKKLNPTVKLDQAGVVNGDLLLLAPAQDEGASVIRPPLSRQQQQQQQQQQQTTPHAGTGGLDFSSLLSGVNAAAASAGPLGGGGGGGGGGLDFSNLLMQAGAGTTSHNDEPVYYDGMTLNDAWDSNTRPEHIVKLLQTKDRLMKELNYHQPRLAEKIRNQPHDKAVQIWREEILKGGIQTAMNSTQKFHKEQEFRRRIQQNPNDAEAKEYFEDQKRRQKVQEQYFQMMNEYPESLGRVLMLYIEAKLNGHSVQAFVDSGAQSTIMSERLAREFGLMDLLDTRFKGVAVGVGQGVILGRIHLAQLQLGEYHFPVTLTIMEDPPPGSDAKEMPFLFGLDNLKRHLCQIDLEQHCLKFRVAPGQHFSTPFLHEHELTPEQGGTKGFNAEQSNKELEELQRKQEEKGDDDDDDDM